MAFKTKVDTGLKHTLTVRNKECESTLSIQSVHLYKLGHCKVCSFSVFHILLPASSHMHQHCTPTVNSQSICVLFAADISTTTYHTERDHNQIPSMIHTYVTLNSQLSTNKVTLYFDTNFTKLVTTNKTCINLNRRQGNKTFKETVTSKLIAN